MAEGTQLLEETLKIDDVEARDARTCIEGACADAGYIAGRSEAEERLRLGGERPVFHQVHGAL